MDRVFRMPAPTATGAYRKGRRTSAISPNGGYGIPQADRPQSALMLRARMPLPHFSLSSAMSLPKSAGEPTNAVPPSSASRALILGSARPALMASLSLSIICDGVFFGAPTPNHWLASYPAPQSPTVAIARHIPPPPPGG